MRKNGEIACYQCYNKEAHQKCVNNDVNFIRWLFSYITWWHHPFLLQHVFCHVCWNLKPWKSRGKIGAERNYCQSDSLVSKLAGRKPSREMRGHTFNSNSSPPHKHDKKLYVYSKKSPLQVYKTGRRIQTHSHSHKPLHLWLTDFIIYPSNYPSSRFHPHFTQFSAIQSSIQWMTFN